MSHYDALQNVSRTAQPGAARPVERRLGKPALTSIQNTAMAYTSVLHGGFALSCEAAIAVALVPGNTTQKAHHLRFCTDPDQSCT